MIHLVVPGLLGPLPRFEQEQDPVRYPALERLFARADRVPGADSYPAALFQLFGVPLQSAEPGQLPTATICYHADSGGRAESRYLLHADPIHLRPDQDRLLGFDFHTQPLQPAEAEAFVQAFNRHFAGEGMELLAPVADRWYLALESDPAASFHPLAEMLGRNIDLFLPQGEQASLWAARMNEIQMLFHSLPVNLEREQQGRLPVSGLWFSGGGYLPGPPTQGYVLEGDDCCLVQGLEMLAPAASQHRLMLEHGPGRAILDGDRVAWQKSAADLDRRVEALMRGELWLYTCDAAAWHWKPLMRYRVWRQGRALHRI